MTRRYSDCQGFISFTRLSLSSSFRRVQIRLFLFEICLLSLRSDLQLRLLPTWRAFAACHLFPSLAGLLVLRTIMGTGSIQRTTMGTGSIQRRHHLIVSHSVSQHAWTQIIDNEPSLIFFYVGHAMRTNRCTENLYHSRELPSLTRQWHEWHCGMRACVVCRWCRKGELGSQLV